MERGPAYIIFFLSLSFFSSLSSSVSLFLSFSPRRVSFRGGHSKFADYSGLQAGIYCGWVRNGRSCGSRIFFNIYIFFALNFVCQSVRLREVLKCLGKVFAFGS